MLVGPIKPRPSAPDQDRPSHWPAKLAILTVSNIVVTLENSIVGPEPGQEGSTMISRGIVIALATTFWAVTSPAQAPSWEIENAAGLQAYQRGNYTEAENLFRDAFGRVEEFGELDPRF